MGHESAHAVCHTTATAHFRPCHGGVHPDRKASITFASFRQGYSCTLFFVKAKLLGAERTGISAGEGLGKEMDKRRVKWRVKGARRVAPGSRTHDTLLVKRLPAPPHRDLASDLGSKDCTWESFQSKN